MPISESNLKAVNLPPRFFLYDLPQIADMLGITPTQLSENYIYFDRRDYGRKHPDLIMARNLAPQGADYADWRVVDRELIRWMRRKGFRVIDSTVVSS